MWSYQLDGPSSLRQVEVDASTSDVMDEGQVLLRTLAGGICGSDLPYYRGELPLVAIAGVGSEGSIHGFPLHEVVGEVIASRDDTLPVGMVVVGWAASMSGLSEQILANGAMLVEVPAGMTPTRAVMLQPLACVLEAVERLGDVRGRSAAVLGLGPIGLLFAHVLSTRGAGPVVGVDRVDRSDCADAFGLASVVHAAASSWVARPASQAPPEVVVEAIGHQVGTLGAAIEAVASDGDVLCFGVPDDAVYPFPMSTFFRKNLRLHAGTTRERRRALECAVAHLAAHPGLVDAYVTHVFARDQVNKAFRTACRPAFGQLKVVLDLAAPTDPSPTQEDM